MPKIRAEKDFWAGLLYVVLAAAFLWFGRDYKMGTAARMGPGYFPITLGWILGGFGVVSIIRSLTTDGEPIGGIAWKKLSILTLSVIAFAVILPKLGLIFALPALVGISSLGSEQSEYNLKAVLALVALTAFCILVFVKGLGVPMPIFGAWFDGVVPPSWQR